MALRVVLHIFETGKLLVPTGNRTPYHPVHSLVTTMRMLSWFTQQQHGAICTTAKKYFEKNKSSGEVQLFSASTVLYKLSEQQAPSISILVPGETHRKHEQQVMLAASLVRPLKGYRYMTNGHA